MVRAGVWRVSTSGAGHALEARGRGAGCTSGLPETASASGASRVRTASPGVRIHLLGDLPAMAIVAVSPDPARATLAARQSGAEPGRASLLVRRRSAAGEALSSALRDRVRACGQGVPSAAADRPRLVRTRCDRRARGNRRRPGVSAGEPESWIDAAGCVAGRTYVSFDGLAARVREHEVVLAGGTFAEGAGRLVSQPNLAGTLTGSVRRTTDRGLGWFITPEHLADGPGNCRPLAGGRAWRRHVPVLDPRFGRIAARRHSPSCPGRAGLSHRSPQRRGPVLSIPQVKRGPHRFRVSQIAR